MAVTEMPEWWLSKGLTKEDWVESQREIAAYSKAVPEMIAYEEESESDYLDGLGSDDSLLGTPRHVRSGEHNDEDVP